MSIKPIGELPSIGLKLYATVNILQFLLKEKPQML